MDGNGNNVVPERFWMTYLDGGVPVPIPDSVSRAPRAGGFTFPAHDGHCAAIYQGREADDHLRRVRRNARRMPEVAALLGGEDVLVHLMYGDIDECCRLFQAPPIAPAAGPYANCYYVSNC